MCDYSGYPSADGNIRLFTESECAAKGGVWAVSGNGECLRPEGGSYSWDCREKNKDSLDMVYQKKYYIVGIVLAGGFLWWRMSRK